MVEARNITLGALLKQDLHMFTGKGGVGKSIVALSYAQKLAQTEGNTILVELADMSYFAALMSRPIDYRPQVVSEGLKISKFSGFDCLKEYVTFLVKVPQLADLFFNNKVMSAFVDAAPGLKELAVLGKLTSGLRQWGPEFSFRHIVVDAYSSGHFLSLLKAPLGLSKVIDMGPMGEQTRGIFKTLSDPQSVHYNIVTLPEEMPVTESLELNEEIKELTGQNAKIYLNKFIAEVGIDAPVGASASWRQEFFEYMNQQNEKILHAEKTLQDSGLDYQKLPFIYEVQGTKIADQLQKSFEGDLPQ